MCTPRHFPLSSCRYENRRCGFALAIALMLMAFIVLLLVSFSTIAMLETRTAETREHHTLAQQNALLGLQLAIGQLQTTLGPDQRISARADILSATGDEPLDTRKYWTGVWNGDGAHADHERGERIGWLVSGNVDVAVGHQEAGAGDEVTLLGGGSATDVDKWVHLPRVPLGPADTTSGHIAYWVGDEGIKARYNLAPQGSNDLGTGNIRAVSPATVGLSYFPEMGAAASMGNTLSQVSSFSGLSLVHSEMGDSRSYFHDMSFHSGSVLANVREGGLKYDLTSAFENDAVLPDLTLVDPDFPSLELFRSYYQLKNELEEESGIQVAEPRVQRADQHDLHPVFLRFHGNFGAVPSDLMGTPVLYPDPVSGASRLLFTMRPYLVLANPHDVDLAPADYELIWEPEPGVNDLTLRVAFPDWAAILRPHDILGGSLRLLIENEPFRAGEVKFFTLADIETRYQAGSGIRMANADNVANFLYVDSGHPMPPSAFDNDGELDWDVAFAPRLFEPAYTRFRLLVDGEDAVIYERVFNGRRTRGNIAFSEALDYGFVMRYQNRPSQAERNAFGNPGGGLAHEGGLSFIANLNHRSVRNQPLPFSDFIWSTHPVFHWHFHTGADSSSNWVVQTDATGKRSFWGNSMGTSEGESFVTFYHAPRSPLLSLGQLQHVNASPDYGGSYSLGHSWASIFQSFSEGDYNYRLNAHFWDRYFFSGYVDEEFLNPRISALAPDSVAVEGSLSTPVEAAASLMVEGSFNINSTSIKGWEMLLASLIDRQVSYFDVATEGRDVQVDGAVGSAVLRSLAPASSSNSVDGMSQWNGFRRLSDVEINRLAGQIVHQIKTRGPFLSLADFVNRDIADDTPGLYSPRMMGTLQAAIDNDSSVVVDGTSYPPTAINSQMAQPVINITNAGLPLPNEAAHQGLARNRGAPGYLTQGDILSMLGSHISARSDTFKVRSYGDWENPVTGENVTAVCEAIVQRFPDPVSPDGDNPLEASEETKSELGRKFRIVSFRWLSPDEV